MAQPNSKPRRNDPKFDEFIDNISMERQKLFPKEKLTPQSPRRITLALTRIPELTKIKKKIIEADLP